MDDAATTEGARAGAQAAWTRVRTLPYATELAVLVAAMIAIQFFPAGAPTSVYASGIVSAAPLALAALGIVLVYRANRFINFAQLQMATWAGVLFDGLARGRPLLRAAHAVCGCGSIQSGGTAVAINFVLSAILAILAAALIGVIYAVLVRRFVPYGQLVLTLVSVAVAEVLAGSEQTIDQKLAPASLQMHHVISTTLTPPTDVTVTVGGFPLHLNSLLLVGAALVAVIGVAAYLRFSSTGVAVRAAAENPARAETLGVNVSVVSARVWALSGLLAGVAGVLGAFEGGASTVQMSSTSTAVDVGTLTLVLVCVVAARFVNIWMAGLAALVLGVVESAVQLSYSSVEPLDAALVFIVGGLFLLQGRRRSGRGDSDDFSTSELIRELRPIPRELRNLDGVRRWRRIGFGAATVFLVGIPFVISASQASLLGDWVIFALVGLSVLVLSGWAGQAALGQFGFGAVGAWAAATSGLPFPLAVVLGGLAGSTAAVLIGIPGLRLKGLSLGVTSMAFSVSAAAIFTQSQYLGKHLPLSLKRPSLFGLDLSSPVAFYFLALVVLLLACGAVVGLRRTRTGRVLIALRSNEPAAQSFGISPTRARLAAYALSGFLAAVAGALLAYNLGSVAPTEYTGEQSLQLLIFAIIGGLGGLAGPLIGFTYGWLLTFLPNNPLLQYGSTGLGLLLLLYFLPGGLAQGAYDFRDSMLRRVAYRLRISVPSLMGDKAAAALGDKVSLAEPRPVTRVAGEPLPLAYKPPGQWALDRFGRDGASEERVGA